MLKKLTIKQNLIVTTLPYIFVHFDLPPPVPQQVFWYYILNNFWGAVFCTCILNTFEIMYLYLYFNNCFGWYLYLYSKYF